MLRIQNEYRRIAQQCAEIAEAYAGCQISSASDWSEFTEMDYSIGGRLYAADIAKAIRAKFNLPDPRHQKEESK